MIEKLTSAEASKGMSIQQRKAAIGNALFVNAAERGNKTSAPPEGEGAEDEPLYSNADLATYKDQLALRPPLAESALEAIKRDWTRLAELSDEARVKLEWELSTSRTQSVLVTAAGKVSGYALADVRTALFASAKDMPFVMVADRKAATRVSVESGRRGFPAIVDFNAGSNFRMAEVSRRRRVPNCPVESSGRNPY